VIALSFFDKIVLVVFDETLVPSRSTVSAGAFLISRYFRSFCRDICVYFGMCHLLADTVQGGPNSAFQLITPKVLLGSSLFTAENKAI